MEHTLTLSRDKVLDALSIVCEYETLFVEKEKNDPSSRYILEHIQEVKKYMREKIKEKN
jgi:hypothetical protein